MKLTFVFVLLGLVALAHCSCMPGYEPSGPFPGCLLRQSQAIQTVFAALLNGSLSSDFAGRSVSRTDAAKLWTIGATIGSRPTLLNTLEGCFDSMTGLMEYDTVTTVYKCGCLEDCSSLAQAYFDINYYIFNNNIHV